MISFGERQADLRALGARELATSPVQILAHAISPSPAQVDRAVVESSRAIPAGGDHRAGLVRRAAATVASTVELLPFSRGGETALSGLRTIGEAVLNIGQL